MTCNQRDRYTSLLRTRVVTCCRLGERVRFFLAEDRRFRWLGCSGSRWLSDRGAASRQGRAERKLSPAVCDVIIFVGGYCVLCQPMGVISRAARAASAMSSAMYGRLPLCNAVLDRLAQDLDDMA